MQDYLQKRFCRSMRTHQSSRHTFQTNPAKGKAAVTFVPHFRFEMNNQRRCIPDVGRVFSWGSISTYAAWPRRRAVNVCISSGACIPSSARLRYNADNFMEIDPSELLRKILSPIDDNRKEPVRMDWKGYIAYLLGNQGSTALSRCRGYSPYDFLLSLLHSQNLMPELDT